MRISRTEPASRAGSGAHARRIAGAQDAGNAHPADGRVKAVRGPWAVVCAMATVVLGPAAVTASALDQANAAPMHHTVRAEQPQAYIPSDLGRRRTAA
ncbi:hypothetical protein [Streptomyces sp. NPDC005251]|uniref:hypothetical protein n=1 Tax=unclassified Streptomyces TaxID=2593676 RepID=UPI0033B10DD9